MKTNKPTLTLLELKTDHRGWFAEVLRPHQVTKKAFGQLSFTTINPGRIKGNHYHKFQHEWFVCVNGTYKMETIHAKTKESIVIHQDSHTPSVIYIPPLWNHTLRNDADTPATVLLYTDVPNDVEHPDVYTL